MIPILVLLMMDPVLQILHLVNLLQVLPLNLQVVKPPQVAVLLLVKNQAPQVLQVVHHPLAVPQALALLVAHQVNNLVLRALQVLAVVQVRAVPPALLARVVHLAHLALQAQAAVPAPLAVLQVPQALVLPQVAQAHPQVLLQVAVLLVALHNLVPHPLVVLAPQVAHLLAKEQLKIQSNQFTLVEHIKII